MVGMDLLHNNIYPTGRHFRVTSMESIASDMGVGRILHQSIFPQQVQQPPHPAPLQRFRIFPILGKPD